MLLRNKENDCIYAVTSEYHQDFFAIYAEAKQPLRDGEMPDNFYWVYTTLKDFNEAWEDVD
ncbi:MAG: hypothetical protein NC548_27130 [Lachnospiraceae bacterium]|nr:hypothetical protein [Lachnospiraceae bacterium]